MNDQSDDPMLEAKLDELTRRFEAKSRDDAEKHQQNRSDIHRLNNAMDSLILQQRLKLDNVLELKNTVKRGFSEMDKKLDAISGQSEKNQLLMSLVVGDGQPGQGRLGAAEKSIEILRRYAWQFAGGVAVVLFLLDLFFHK